MNHNEEVLIIRADATSISTVLCKINGVHVKVYINLQVIESGVNNTLIFFPIFRLWCNVQLFKLGHTCLYKKLYEIMQDLRFSQQCCWRSKSSRTWRRVVGQINYSISKDRNSLFFGVRTSKNIMQRYRLLDFVGRMLALCPHLWLDL